MKNGFETKDLFESSFLYAKLNIFPRTRLDPSEHFIWFIFPDPSKCEELIVAYRNHQATVDPKTYADSFRSLKDIIFRSGIKYSGGARC